MIERTGAGGTDDEMGLGEKVELRFADTIDAEFVIAETQRGKRDAASAFRSERKFGRPEPVMLDGRVFPLDFEFDGSCFSGGEMQRDERFAFADDDGGRERARFKDAGRIGIQDGVDDVVGSLVGVAPDVDVRKLDTVSGGGAGPEVGG